VDLVRNDRVFPLLKSPQKGTKGTKEFFVPFVPFCGLYLSAVICHFGSDAFCLFASKLGELTCSI
jgi:hypothetical protein